MRRIGVFVCHCGTNIAATVDVKTVAETLGKEPAVVYATDYPYMCSEGRPKHNQRCDQGVSAGGRCCMFMFAPYA